MGKSVSHDGNKFSKKANTKHSELIAQTVSIKELTTDLPSILTNLKPDEALIYGWVPGTEEGNPYNLLSSKALKHKVSEENALGIFTDSNGECYVSRYIENYQYSTLVLFDVDVNNSMPQ